MYRAKYVRGWITNYPQCSCIRVSVGSTVVCTCIASRGFLLITAVPVSSRSVSSFVPTVTLTMAGPLSVCTKEEQRSVIRFVVVWRCIRGPKCIEDFQHNTGTVFCSNGVSTNGEKNSKMVAQVLRMKEAVHAWLAAQPKTFFCEGIKKLVQRWKKCIEKQGDYVEKWCYCKLYVSVEIQSLSVVRMIIDSTT